MVALTAILLAAGSSFSHPNSTSVNSLQPRADCTNNTPCPGSDGCTFTTDNGDQFVVQCGMDLYGGDLQVTHAPTMDECLTACSYTNNCVGVSYVNPNCYLKSSIKPAVANPAATAANITGPTATTPEYFFNNCTSHGDTINTFCPRKHNMPDSGCLADTSNAYWQVRCGRDFYGGDYAMATTFSFEQCLRRCDDAGYTNCNAVSFVSENAGTRLGRGLCYMKHSVGAAVVNDGVIGGYVAQVG